jgi:hypothetical protein
MMISGIDIEDWDRGEPVPLYSVRPKTYVEWLGVTYWFDHVDGKDCYCMTWDTNSFKQDITALLNHAVLDEHEILDAIIYNCVMRKETLARETADMIEVINNVGLTD